MFLQLRNKSKGVAKTL